MKKILNLIIGIILSATVLYAGNFFDDLKKISNADKLEKKNQRLQEENTRLKQQLEKLSRIKYVNLAAVQFGTKIYQLRPELTGETGAQKIFFADFRESRNIDKITVTDSGGNAIPFQVTYFDAVFENWVPVQLTGQNILTARLQIAVPRGSIVAGIAVYGYN